MIKMSAYPFITLASSDTWQSSQFGDRSELRWFFDDKSDSFCGSAGLDIRARGLWTLRGLFDPFLDVSDPTPESLLSTSAFRWRSCYKLDRNSVRNAELHFSLQSVRNDIRNVEK